MFEKRVANYQGELTEDDGWLFFEVHYNLNEKYCSLNSLSLQSVVLQASTSSCVW